MLLRPDTWLTFFHRFIVGHVTPEAAVGGPIALVRDGDMVTIDAQTNTISMDVSEDEIAERRKAWKKPSLTVTRGVLAKYAKLVGDASHGMCQPVPSMSLHILTVLQVQ